MAKRLAGTYRVLIITSEGTGAKWIAEAVLGLAPTPPAQDSIWRHLWIRGKRETYFPLVGVMSFRGGGYFQADGTLAPPSTPWEPPPDSVRIHYDPAAGKLRMETDPFDTFDAGMFYPIFAVDTLGGFTGRWITGGYAMMLIPTPLGTLAEQDSGYFCANRQPSHSQPLR